MEEKRAVDGFGASLLIGFATVLAFNQVVIKVTGQGFNPVFQAGLRSVLALIVLSLWMRWCAIPLAMPRRAMLWGLVSGLLFTYEFILLFLALDLTSVSRVSILFYTMPVWVSVLGHFLLPGEQLTKPKLAGLSLAIAGIVLALANRGGGAASWLGDFCALGAAFGWAGINLLVRVTPLSEAPPENQLFYQLAVSGVIMTAISPAFGVLLRDPTALHIAGLLFQAICVASLAFLLWFWLLKRYKANQAAVFSFLTPVLAVLLGWAVLGEPLEVQIWLALGLVLGGIWLVTRG